MNPLNGCSRPETATPDSPKQDMLHSIRRYPKALRLVYAKGEYETSDRYALCYGRYSPAGLLQVCRPPCITMTVLDITSICGEGVEHVPILKHASLLAQLLPLQR